MAHTRSDRPAAPRRPACALHPKRPEILAILADARARIDRINGVPA